MANPFYIPNENKNIGNILMGGAQMLAQQKMSAADLDLRRKTLDINQANAARQSKVDDRNYALNVRKADQTDRQLGIQEAAANAPDMKTPAFQQILDTKATMKVLGKAKVALGEFAFKAMQPVVDDILDLSASGLSRLDAANTLISKWPKYRKEILPKLQRQLLEDPEMLNTPEGEGMAKLVDAIGQDNDGRIVKNLFADTFRTYEEYQAGLENDRMRAEGRDAAPKPIKSWVLPDGRVANIPNNQQPPEGARPYSTGMSVEVGPDGTTRVMTGVDNTEGGGISKPMQTAIQKDNYQARQAANRVANAISDFQTKFATLPFRAGAKWEEFKQILGAKPDPAKTAELREFKSWYKNAQRDFALAIQELGQGNLTKNEQKLYGFGLPDPGSDVIPKEAPAVYYDALVDRYKGLNTIVARTNYYLKNGLTQDQIFNMTKDGTVISAKQMETIIDDRAEEIMNEIKSQNPGMDPGIILQQATGKVKQEFGLGG